MNWKVARIMYVGPGRMLTFAEIVYRTEVDRQECKNVQESLMAYPNGVRVLNHNINPARARVVYSLNSSIGNIGLLNPE